MVMTMAMEGAMVAKTEALLYESFDCFRVDCFHSRLLTLAKVLFVDSADNAMTENDLVKMWYSVHRAISCRFVASCLIAWIPMLQIILPKII